MFEIKKRLYIARNKIELIEILNKYRDGKLLSKYSEEIVDNYIYPVTKGNLRKNIAKYIVRIIK